MLREPELRIKAENILVQKNKSDDLKLFEVFQIYKEDLQKECSQLYYALLAWKDSHLKDLLTEQSEKSEMTKDRIDIIFELLAERGKEYERLDIPTINSLIQTYADARRKQDVSYGWIKGCTTMLLEKELRWLKSQMFDKNVEVVYR